MHIWLVESSIVEVLHKANFSIHQRNRFHLTLMVVIKHREGSSNSIPIKVINNPTILIKSDEILKIVQVLDTQNCP